MRTLRLLAVAAIVAVSLPTAATAQATSATTRSAAPLAAQAAVGVRRAAYAPAPTGKPAPFRQDTRQNRALMIVGGAAMLTGAVVGHDSGALISVGGAVVFLWGLYQYLQ